MRRFVLLLPLLVACRAPCPACPTLPDRPVAPAPVVHVQPLPPVRPPCVLPPRPDAVEMRGTATALNDGVVVTNETLRVVATFLVEINAWASAAALCLETR